MVEDVELKCGIIGLLVLGFKLFKSVKVVKVVLVGVLVVGYVWFFFIEFVLMLIVCLVVYEYGYVCVMKYFGIKIKGIYFILFVGGLVVFDDKIIICW